MKIRMGFITNSSSTNFLIISKEELTEEYLFEKLGFIKDGMLEKQGRELCRSIIYALDGGLRYHNYEIPDYESIKKVFGEKSARLFVKNKGYHAYRESQNDSRRHCAHIPGALSFAKQLCNRSLAVFIFLCVSHRNSFTYLPAAVGAADLLTL